MASKILAMSSNGEMLKIEKADAPKGYVWYFMADNVKTFVKTNGIKSGDEVEYHSEEIKGEDTITYIKKISGTSDTPHKTYGKSPEEQATIKAQAIGHMTSRTMINRAAGKTYSEVEEEIRKLYSLYKELVG